MWTLAAVWMKAEFVFATPKRATERKQPTARKDQMALKTIKFQLKTTETVKSCI